MRVHYRAQLLSQVWQQRKQTEDSLGSDCAGCTWTSVLCTSGSMCSCTSRFHHWKCETVSDNNLSDNIDPYGLRIIKCSWQFVLFWLWLWAFSGICDYLHIKLGSESQTQVFTGDAAEKYCDIRYEPRKSILDFSRARIYLCIRPEQGLNMTGPVKNNFLRGIADWWVHSYISVILLFFSLSL